MRGLIGPDLMRTLKCEAKDIRDTKLTGFVLRCRPSGSHSYLVSAGRGRWRTIGTVQKMTPQKARMAAESFLADISREALRLQSEDPSLNLRDAKAHARREASRGAKKRPTWKQFVDDTYGPWVSEHRKTGTETVARLRSQFAHFDNDRINDISAFAVERWRSRRLKSGTKPATVNRDLAAFRAALTKALEWRVLKMHPMATVKASKVDATGHIRFLSEAEEAALRDALTVRDVSRRRGRDNANAWRRARGYELRSSFGVYTDHLHPLVLLALNTGCRRGELLGLRWQDIDLTGARLCVRAEGSKSGLSRVIPLNDEAVAVLRDWMPADVAPSTHVFEGGDGAPLTDLKTAFLKLMRDAKIVGFRFHDLRHTFASQLVMAGVDLNTIRELLGHADLKMTIRYAHLAPEHKAAAVAKLLRA